MFNDKPPKHMLQFHATNPHTKPHKDLTTEFGHANETVPSTTSTYREEISHQLKNL